MINATYLLENLLEVMSLDDLLHNIVVISLKAETKNVEENKGTLKYAAIDNLLYEIQTACRKGRNK